MIFLKRLKWPALLGVLLLTTCVACEEDLTTIGDGLIGNEPFFTNSQEFNVFAFNKNIEAVQTNKLPVYQLGVYEDPVFGRTEAQITSQLRLSQVNPSFGIYSQAVEDSPDSTVPAQQWGHPSEEEEVKEVYLYIPYLTQSSTQRDSDNDGVDDVFDEEPNDPNNDSDLDSVSNAQEKANGTDPLDILSFEVDANNPANTYAKKFDLDSIYGNRDLAFNLKIERSTYYLRDLDPTTDFQDAQEYFSTQEFAPSYVSDVFFEGPVQINDREILTMFKEDDTETEADETLLVETRLSPGIKVPLDVDFFQQNFIDNEGGSELLSQANFTEFLRGIHLSVTPEAGEEMMLLLDISQANITVVYDYWKVDINGTSDDSTDDVVTREEEDLVINLIQFSSTSGILGNAVNTLINEPYSGELSAKLDAPENADKIYLKGGSGTYAEIRLFGDEEDGLAEAINEIKAKNWIINEANLVFYVDRPTLDAMGQVSSTTNDEPSREPERLYLYKAETGEPLINFATEVTTEENLFGRYLNYDGVVSRDDSGLAQKYTIKITDHINNIVVRDSANVALGITLTADINQIGTIEAMVKDGEEKDLPAISRISPLGTVLYGSELDNQNLDKRLKLEIFYTEAN